MPPRAVKPPPSPDSLKRERAGTYRTTDGRFTVEQTSSGWLVLDAEQTDGLGLPLARGPFATLDLAREAIPSARIAPAPTHAVPLPVPAPRSLDPGKEPRPVAPAPANRPKPPPKPPAQKRPAPLTAAVPIVTREVRVADGDSLRKLWTAAGLGSLGDDDRSLARMVRRNPGLVLVAVEGTRIVGSALGGWDGRRGWIYHVATLQTHRRRGIATRLVEQIEAGLAVLGCPKVNAMVQEANGDGREFWIARGYKPGTARQLAKEL